MDAPRTIGVISGNGIYPETFINAARQKSPGVKIVVAAFEGETKEGLGKLADAIEWFRVGQLSKIINFFQQEGANEAVMVGQIAPKNLFNLRPDMRILMMLARIKKRNAESLFTGIAEEIKKDGIELLSAVTFLEELLPEVGHVCGPTLKKRQIEDAEYGFGIAKESSRMDIGQSVIVRHGTVLAVEAFEGTNACIRRGGELGRKKDITLAKVSKPRQDMRFDVPVIGPDTIKNAAENGVKVIVIEAGMTLLLGWSEIESLCKKSGVSLFAMKG